MKAILDSLGLEPINDGTWYGSESTADAGAPLIESINPASGEVIASVRGTTAAEYESLIANHSCFLNICVDCDTLTTVRHHFRRN